MDSFLYVTCMNESKRGNYSFSFSSSIYLAFSKNIQPTTEQNLQEIEADDLLLKGRRKQNEIEK